MSLDKGYALQLSGIKIHCIRVLFVTRDSRVKPPRARGGAPYHLEEADLLDPRKPKFWAILLASNIAYGGKRINEYYGTPFRK